MNTFIGKLPPWVLLLVSLAFTMEITKASDYTVDKYAHTSSTAASYITFQR